VLGLVVTVPAGEAELAADALWALGVVAIEERGGTTGTEDDLMELWTSLGDDPETVRRAAEAFPARWRWRVVELDPSVTEAWRAHARASWIERDLVVVPAWLPFEATPGLTVVRIEPGATFGLGDHPTTVLSIRGVRAALVPNGTVLDVGCGSGVLAVTAAVLGARSATAIDISPAAPAIAAANAAANGVEERVHASTMPLAEVEGTFDVVVANLLAPALLTLADDLIQVLAPEGALVISGLLTERHEHVVAALAPLRPVERRTKEGWTAITLRHP
jgi:ribosomal protein L11 methyltransferase